MKFSNQERRSHPRFFIDLPLDHREVADTRALGGMVMNASETVFLIECVKDIPIGTRLWVSVLFPKGFELADFEVEATIIWKELLLKEDWEGYEYGLNIIRISDEDYSKLKLLLQPEFNLGGFAYVPYSDSRYGSGVKEGFFKVAEINEAKPPFGRL